VTLSTELAGDIDVSDFIPFNGLTDGYMLQILYNSNSGRSSKTGNQLGIQAGCFATD
jgi:hypothetical protein